MKFLGIDPGIELTGFSIITIDAGKMHLVECGVVRTEKTQSVSERLHHVHADLSTILQRHPDIQAGGVEELFFSKNVKTAMTVSHARGVILFTLYEFGVTLYNIKPVEVKSLVTGSGAADKKTVQRTVQLLFQLPSIPQPDDAADAIAVAIATAALYQQDQR